MSLSGRFARAVLKRVEASPRAQARIARSERTRPVISAARGAAYSSHDDETARAKLCERLTGDAEAVEEALAHYLHRDDYIADRAYRLLAAASAGTTVEATPPGRAELFEQEQALGRLPIAEAFERLTEIEPGLVEARRQASVLNGGAEMDRRGLTRHIREGLGELVGGGARSGHPLLSSTLATSIVHQYLQIAAGNTRFGTADVAYFDSAVKQVVASNVLVDFRRRKRR